MSNHIEKNQNKSTAAVSRLSWTLAICTYNRPDFLIETLKFALAQTRPPVEIVVVDASDNWDDHRDRVIREFADHWSRVALVYEPATVRSLTFQRNQAMNLATSDIVFSIDDDIYLFADAADKIMRIYEADPEHKLAMVAGQFTADAPGVEAQTEDHATTPPTLVEKLRAWVQNQLTLDGHFVPYGEEVDRGQLSQRVQAAGGTPGGLINGGRTTVRREMAVETGWSELLRYYSTHEDSDFSYRMSHMGRLAHATQAGFFHADGNEMTRGRYLVNLIRVRNLVALHVIHSQNRWRSAFRLSSSFLKFAALYTAIDPIQKRFSFPTARAYLYGLVQVPFVLFWPFKDFPVWYTGLQEKMYNKR